MTWASLRRPSADMTKPRDTSTRRWTIAAPGYRPELAWTCSDYAETLLDRDAPGDREKAVELQDEAIAIAQEPRVKPLRDRLLAQRETLKSSSERAAGGMAGVAGVAGAATGDQPGGRFASVTTVSGDGCELAADVGGSGL